MSDVGIDTLSARSAHFVGCGGAGMVGLAKICLEKGWDVSGSDTEESANTRWLAESGARVFFGHAEGNYPPGAALVRSSAVSLDNPEVSKAASMGAPIFLRGEFLALLASGYKRVVAVAGCHGKTTITAMAAHILREAGMGAGHMVGGRPIGFPSAAAGDGGIFVTEADESDLTFTRVKPHLGIVPNVEDDHSWSVGGEERLRQAFAEFAGNCGRLLFGPEGMADSIFRGMGNAVRLDLEAGAAEFSDMSKWGCHQRKNAFLAVEAASALGLSRAEAARHVRTFRGVARRMVEHFDDGRAALVEDYAHHPTELAACLKALRESYPGRRVVVLFQPHRHARLEKYLHEYAALLKEPDAALVAPVFAAWCEKGSVDSSDLARLAGVEAAAGSWEAVADALLARARPLPAVLAVIGAGDVNKTLPRLLSVFQSISDVRRPF